MRWGKGEEARELKGEGRAVEGGHGKGDWRTGERRGGEGKNDLTHPLSQIPGYATDVGSSIRRRKCLRVRH